MIKKAIKLVTGLLITFLVASLLQMSLLIGKQPSDEEPGLASLGNVLNLRTAYNHWKVKHELNGGDQNLVLPLGWSKALSAEFTKAKGQATLNLIGGMVCIEVHGLPQEGFWDVWLVDNRPGPGNSVMPEPGDVMVRVGRLKHDSSVARLQADLGHDAFSSFDVDLVVVTRDGQNPDKGGVLFGSPTLFQRLYRRAEHRVRGNSDQSVLAVLMNGNLAYADGGQTLVEMGSQLFFNETFGGNGRTCGTCHPAGNNFTIDPTFIATLSNNNPLFVAEFIDALNFDKNGGLRFENPVLMRQSGLIVENLDGFGDLANKFVMRGVPHVFAQSASITPATFFMDGSTVPPSQRTGWGGDGAPGGGTLRDFATGAVTQHFPLTLNRTPGVDFRLPTDAELDALEAFQLAQGRQAELDLFALPLTDSDEIAGRILFNGTGKCNQCHLNAGATLDGTQNVNFDTGVEEFLQNQLTVGGEPRPRDGGFGTVSNPDGSFGNGTFNTPSIAEAAGTGPFFHNNAVVTLEDAVDFYNSSEFNNSPGGQVVSGISLTNQEVQQIAAFLLAINAANVSGGNHNTGQGFTPGSSNNAFFRFQLNNFASTADFNSLNFAITGSYQSTDIVNFKLWSSTDNTFESASDTLLATDTTISGNGETVNFTAFSNTLSQTTTHYFVTVDLAATASGADNIAGAITASGDIGFASGTFVSGTFPISGSDHSLPVELSAFSGTITQEGVLLKWRTQSETNNLGFHAYRSETKDGKYVRITPTLIKGHGTDATPHDYSFLDNTAEEGQSYWYLIEDIDFSGITEKSDPIQVGFSRKAVPLKVLPAHFALYQNYPNPFNPETWFPYDLAEQANVEITIYNASGKQIRTLSLGAQPAGKYLTKDRAAYWDGRSDTDERVSSGIYYYHFRAGDYSATKKMIILK